MGASAAAGRGGLSREWQAAHGAPQALQSLEGQFRGATRRAHSFGLPIVFAGIPPPPPGAAPPPPPGGTAAPFPPLSSGAPITRTDSHRMMRAVYVFI